MAVNDENIKKDSTALIIHGFAVAHAATAFSLSQTMVGDEIVLPALMIAMIECIAKVNDKKWSVADARAVIGIMAGHYFGTRLGVMLIKWIPGLGNGANAAAAFSTAEILGWTAYMLINEDRRPSELTEVEKKTMLNDARKLRNDKTGEELYLKMESEDKRKFNDLITQIRKTDKDNDTVREELFLQLEEIIKKYNSRH